MFGHTNRGARGAILQDGKHVADTIQCVHCAKHWVPQPGSGIRRGFCMKCMGPVCGVQCERCYPFEKWLEDTERLFNKFGGVLLDPPPPKPKI